MSDLHGTRFELDLPRNRQFQVVALGQNSVDLICYLPRFPRHNSKLRIDSFDRSGGGPAATAAALCARYGLRTRYVGRVGDDELGRFSMRSLAAEPIDLSCVDTVPGAETQSAFILVDRTNGERTVLWNRDPRLDYKPGELRRALIVAGQVLHLDGADQSAAIEAARWARQEGMIVALDIDALRSRTDELLRLVDFAVASEDFLTQLAAGRSWRSGLERLAGLTRVAISPKGERGCCIFLDGEIVEVPGFSVKAFDTTAAQAVFGGALCFALFQGWSVWRSLRFCNAAAALFGKAKGEQRGVPALENVLNPLD